MNQNLPAIQSLIEGPPVNFSKPMPMEIPMSKWAASVPFQFDQARGHIDAKTFQLSPLTLLNNQPNITQMLGPSDPMFTYVGTGSTQNSVHQNLEVVKSIHQNAEVVKSIDQNAEVVKSIDQNAGVKKSVDQNAGVKKSVDQKSGMQMIGGTRFKCICGLFFQTKDDFHQHYQNKCLSILHACDKCIRRFVRKQDLARHKLMMHANTLLFCLKCNQKFTKIKSLERHSLACSKREKLFAYHEAKNSYARE